MCGRVIGYQYHSADAFAQDLGPQTIEGPYADGVSLTHGLPGTRQHIWTFAAGVVEMGHCYDRLNCYKRCYDSQGFIQSFTHLQHDAQH